MTKWKYLKGSEKDFDGAHGSCDRKYSRDGVFFFSNFEDPSADIELIAQREPITDEDDLNECIGAPEGRVKVGELQIDGKEHVAFLGSKYHREIKPGVWVDVYDVLKAWNVTNPALQHLIKKALQPGERGHKTLKQDMQDIIDSAIRAKELEINK